MTFRSSAEFVLERYRLKTNADDAAERAGIYLHPGQIVFPDRPATITTILGSCVAVCLWNRRTRHGGMNHFLLPDVVDNGQSSPRFGNVAVRMLVDAGLAGGGSVYDLEARLFGGACVVDAFRAASTHLGEKNVRAAREFLGRYGVPIVEEQTGGISGRKVIYESDTGTAVVKPIARSQAG